MTNLTRDSSELESNCTDPSSLVSWIDDVCFGAGTKNFAWGPKKIDIVWNYYACTFMVISKPSDSHFHSTFAVSVIIHTLFKTTIIGRYI